MITFQPATTRDISLLQQLAHTIWHTHYPGIISTEQIEYMLNLMYSANTIEKELNLDYKWVLMLIKDQPIGFISYNNEAQLKKVKLSKLYLLPSYHGKGYGQQALEYVKKCAEELNATILYLTVHKQNKKAIAAYLKAGFYLEKEIKIDIGNGFFMDDYVMAYKL